MAVKRDRSATDDLCEEVGGWFWHGLDQVLADMLLLNATSYGVKPLARPSLYESSSLAEMAI